MANQRKIIGRIPVYRGEWTIDNSPYHKLNDVTLYGCTFRSKIESNSYPPATIGSNGELVVNENWSLISSGYESEKINEDIAFIDKNSSAYNVSRFHIHSGFWEAIEYDESQEAYMEAKEYASGSKVNLVNYTNYTFVAKKAMTGIQPDINNITNKFTLEEAVLFVPNKYQLSGLDIGFISSDTNKPVFHRYNGGLFTSILNWTEDVYEKLTELENKTFFLSENTLSSISDYLVNKEGLTAKEDNVNNIIITDNAYYDENGNIQSSDNYVCGEIKIDDSYKFISLKFADPLTYVAKSFFANEDGFILQYIGSDGNEENFIIPNGATKVCISSRKTSDGYQIITGVPQPTYQLNNIEISPFARKKDIDNNNNEIKSLNDEAYRREVAISNDSPIEISIDLHDNAYFDNGLVEQSSKNFNCFKVDVSQYINQYMLLDAYCFGNSYSAKSAITDKDNNIIRYVSNEGILSKYIFIPINAKYLYVSNRKYNDVEFNNIGSKVLSVNMPKLYSVNNNTPTLLDTRHYTEINRQKSNKYFHFSLDDFKDAISDIVTNANTYNSIFDNSTFAKLREWHDKYGIVISLYLQRTMSDVPSKFKNDFIYNKGWLKFGYHGNGPSWETATYENGKQLWNDFVDGIMTSIGSYDIIDRVPRNDYFHGTEESCKGERDANCGCLGYLGCDDWGYNAATRKTNYYLTDEQSKYLDVRDRYYDSANQLCIFKTDFRLEQIQERWGSVSSCLNYYKSAEGSMQAFDLIVFSHEWNFMQFVSEAETIFEWALNNGYRFDYPMNILLK